MSQAVAPKAEQPAESDATTMATCTHTGYWDACTWRSLKGKLGYWQVCTRCGAWRSCTP